MSSTLPEDDLSCPVCCDIFRDPVLLPCSHSFCRTCLHSFWQSANSRACPVCRRRASKRSLPSNLALRNLCEAFLQGQKHTTLDQATTVVCSQHGERLKLFCVDDQQPICVVCQASRTHKGHECSPVEEAAMDCKEKLNAALKTVKDKLDRIIKLKMTSAMILEHIKSQGQQIEKQIKGQFLELHQFLDKEEEVRLTELKKEEEKKAQAMRQRDEELICRISTLSDVIKNTEQRLADDDDDDLTLLQNFKSHIERTQTTQQDPERFSGSLMDEAKHLSNLKFSVWEKMQEIAPYYPVTFDPSTAHPCLNLSEDFTTVHYSSSYCPLPNIPERFQLSAEVMGSCALGSGVHSWEVDVSGSDDWILGIAVASVKRKEEVLARPENGFWTLCFRDGEYRAMTSPPKLLKVTGRLQKVRVHLDWDAGKVSFCCPTHGATLHMFTDTFTEKVLPYFYTQSKGPLRILQKPVSILVKKN